MVTKPVTLKALLRVCADLAADDAEPKDDRVKRWARRLAPWTEHRSSSSAEGFYERFPPKGRSSASPASTASSRAWRTSSAAASSPTRVAGEPGAPP